MSGKRGLTEEQRFWAKVDQTVPGGCHAWVGGRHASGYGKFTTGPRKQMRTHFVGLIPDGYQIDHLCRNRWCVNPAHLEPVTPRENIRRSTNQAARNMAAAECRWGHPYDEVNTLRSGGQRHCRACMRERRKRYRAERRST